MVGKNLRFPRPNLAQQRGSAALITTIAISFILVVLFVGATTIATRQIRASINSDNANRALYAAEAGVEDAARRLATDPGFLEPKCNDSATPNVGEEVKVSDSSTAADVAWTCRTVTQSAAELTGNLSKDESLALNLSRATNKLNPDDPGSSFQISKANYMTIEWNNPKVDSTTPVGASLAASYLPTYLTADPTQGWGGRAAALEVTATWLPKKLTAANLSALGNVAPMRTIIASPVGSATKSVDFSPLNGGQGCSGTTSDTNTATCWPTDSQASQGVGKGALQSGGSVSCTNNQAVSYSCKFPANADVNPGNASRTKYNLVNLMKTEYDANYTPGRDPQSDVVQGQSACDGDVINNCLLFLRLKARYASTSYSIRFYDENGQPIYVPDGYATIDVTARSNNYFRRVVAKKRIAPSVYDGIFDSALFSGKTICKTMQVYKDFRGAPDYIQGSGVLDPATGQMSPGALTVNNNAGTNSNNCNE